MSLPLFSLIAWSGLVASCSRAPGLQTSRLINEDQVIAAAKEPCFRPRAYFGSSDSRTLVTAMGPNISSWSTSDFTLNSHFKLKQEYNSYLDSFVDHRRQSIFLGTRGRLLEFDLKSGEKLLEVDLKLTGQAPASATAIGVSADSRLVVSSFLNASEYSLPDPRAIARNNDIRENEDAEKEYDFLLTLIDREHQKLIVSSVVRDTYIRKLFASADGQFIVTVSFTKLQFYQIKSGEAFSVVKSLSIKDYLSSDDERYPFILTAAVSRDYRKVALSLVSKIILVDTESQKIISTMTDLQPIFNPMFAIRSLSFSSDTRQLFGTDLVRRAVVIDTASGHVERSGAIDGVSQSWNRGPYLDYLHNNPYPTTEIDSSGRFFTALAPQNPSDPTRCPGILLKRNSIIIGD